MDDVDLLSEEWERKNVLPALSKFYDEIWTYGHPDIYDPLTGLELTSDIREENKVYWLLATNFAGECSSNSTSSF